jgi:hypothetical protein
MVSTWRIEPKYLAILSARLFVALALLTATTTGAIAAIPPHAPGSICATPSFWCWSVVYGEVGTPCACPTAQGLVGGTYV